MNTRPSEVIDPFSEASPAQPRETRHVFDVLPGGSDAALDAKSDPLADAVAAIGQREVRKPPLPWGKLAVVALLAAAAVAALVMFLFRERQPAIASETAAASGASPAVAAPSPTANAAAALTVSMTAPQSVRWADDISVSGAIAAWQEAVVSAEVSGLKLKEIAVDVGDEVKQGQVLARFDGAMMQSAVDQQRAMVDEANAHLAEAATNARRAQKLRETAAISEQDLIQFVTRAHAAEAELKSAQARLESSELNLKFTTVTAPDNGIISARTAMLGSVAGPGAELFRLVRQNRLEWRAELTGAQLLQVKIGQQAHLTLPDGSKALGTVRQVAPVLDAKSRTGIVYVELDRTQSPTARAGMFASGEIVSGERTGIAVPSAAVVLRDGHEYVFGVNEAGRVEQIKVDTGRRQGDLVEIVNGLQPNQRVIGSGAAFLNNGDPVRVVDGVATPTVDQSAGA